MTLTRADTAAYIRRRTGCPAGFAEKCARLAVERLLNSAASGGRVELRGFGTFRIVETAERKDNLHGGRAVPPRQTVRFKASEALKRLVDGNVR